MFDCYYVYKINNAIHEGIGIYEDNRWLHILDDPQKRKFFCIEDIEKELDVKLTLVRTTRKKENIRN